MATIKMPRKKKGPKQPAQQEAAKPAAPKGSGRATGWRIPLMFCAFFIVAALITWGYRKYTAPPPLPIEAALLDIAGKSSFDLDADEQGRKYKEELISAGRGFSSNSAKDASLEKVAWQAMDEGRIDAVISGAHVIRDDDKRNRLLHSMTIECLRNCDMLPWAVYGVRNIRNDYPTALDLTRKLNERYAQCRAEGWTPKPTTAADFAPETAAGAAPAAEGQAAQDGSAPAEQKDAQ